MKSDSAEEATNKGDGGWGGGREDGMSAEEENKGCERSLAPHGAKDSAPGVI